MAGGLSAARPESGAARPAVTECGEAGTERPCRFRCARERFVGRAPGAVDPVIRYHRPVEDRRVDEVCELPEAAARHGQILRCRLLLQNGGLLDACRGAGTVSPSSVSRRSVRPRLLRLAGRVGRWFDGASDAAS